jgi:hypothetical protein
MGGQGFTTGFQQGDSGFDDCTLFGIKHLRQLLSLRLEKVALVITSIVPTIFPNEIRVLANSMSN